MFLTVKEVFNSISGEVGPFGQGCLTTFVRFTGCNLECPYCFGILPGRNVPKLILSKGGKIRLDDAKVSDTILTYDEEFNIVETTITKTHSREVDRWLRLTIDGTQYFVTHEHPFMTPKGILKAEDLVIGDAIYEVSPNKIIAFKKLGNRNPMKDPSVALRSTENTDYKTVGFKTSRTRKKLFSTGKLKVRHSPETRKKLSKTRLGCANPNWKGGKYKNYNKLKKDISEGLHVCGCGSTRFLEVHHIDGVRKNDNLDNLVVLCKSCHTKVHKKGYNFWNGNRRDGKQLVIAIGNNGKTVEAIKEFDRGKYPPSLRPNPLKVYNLTCEPYNTFFLDNMWVHNCDTPETQKNFGFTETLDIELEEVQKYFEKTGKLCITGGEPLYGNNYEQTKQLIDFFQRNIWIETNGTIDFTPFLLDSTHIVTDFKLHLDQGIPDYFYNLRGYDFVKFPIQSREDYLEAVEVGRSLFLLGVTPFYGFSPINVSVHKLAEWLCEDKLPRALINVQIHKFTNMR
jgi:organic radical activating enzyme/5-methylcytosine-specific restriction endonuclease McrA